MPVLAPITQGTLEDITRVRIVNPSTRLLVVVGITITNLRSQLNLPMVAILMGISHQVVKGIVDQQIKVLVDQDRVRQILLDLVDQTLVDQTLVVQTLVHLVALEDQTSVLQVDRVLVDQSRTIVGQVDRRKVTAG